MQTKFWIKCGEVIGLQLHKKHKRWKQCRWCGNTFLPKHNKQAYCDVVCKHISRQKYNSDWMRKYRIQHRSGEIVNDRSILNIGTGSLGEHCELDCSVELRKVELELKNLGLK